MSDEHITIFPKAEKLNLHFVFATSHKITIKCDNIEFCVYAVVPLPDFLKIGSSAEIREITIEKNIQK